MRFKSLTVREAGPLKDIKIDLKDVNLIVGNNEEGKTTLVDILIQSLYGKKSAFNKGLWNERFDFEGKAVAETEGELPGEDMLKFSSLFIIREGDMKWQGRSAGKKDMLSREMWNEDVREVLYGSDPVLKTLNRKDVVETLGVTAGKGWLVKFLSGLEELSAKTANEIDRVEEYKSNETRLADTRRELGVVEAQLAGLAEARNISDAVGDKELIEHFFSKTDESARTREQLAPLLKKDLDVALKEWEELNRTVASLDREIAGHHADRSSHETRKKEKSDYIEAALSRLDSAREENARREVDKAKKELDIKDRERELLRERDRVAGRPFKRSQSVLLVFLCVFSSVAAIAGVLALLGYIHKLPWEMDPAVMIAAAVSSLVSAGIFLAGRIFRGSASKRKISELESRHGEFLKALRYSVEVLDEDIRNIHKKATDDRALVEKLRAEIADLESGAGSAAIEKKKEELASRKERVSELERAYVSCNELAKLIATRNNLRKKEEELAGDIARDSDKLLKKFGSASPAFLQEELKKLMQELAKASPGGQYHKGRFEELSNGRAVLDETIGHIVRENADIRSGVISRMDETLRNTVKDVKEKFLKDFYSDIGSVSLKNDIYNIYALKGKLDAIVSRVREDIVLGGSFLEVFDRMQSDIGALLDSVLRTERFRSALEKLTNGNYRGLVAKEEADGIRFYLENGDGGSCEFQSLSTGTKNQAYFAVRLALADRLFGDRKGVFILDDAFLSFDEGRRRSAMELLGDYAAEGWQVIYSSVNEKGMESLFESVFGKKLNKVFL